VGTDKCLIKNETFRRGVRMKVLLTGATGYIGRKLAAALVEAGHYVTAFVRPTSNRAGLPDGIQFAEGDMLDEASLKRAVEGHEAVIHLAAYFDFFPSDEELMFEVNVEGTKNILNACAGTTVGRFIYCSTTEAMGGVRFPPGDEETELRPLYSYGESKVKAERAIREISANTGIDHVILRSTGVVGDYVDFVAFEATSALYHGEWPVMPRNDKKKIMLIHIDDVTRAFVAAVISKSALNNTIILCPDGPMSWAEFVEFITSYVDVKPPSIRVPSVLAKAGMGILSPLKNRGRTTFLWHMKSIDAMMEDRWYTNEKAKRLLGWAPEFSMQEALKMAIDWFFESGNLKKE
jgi:dihydroflavonol-4-reductase